MQERKRLSARRTDLPLRSPIGSTADRGLEALSPPVPDEHADDCDYVISGACGGNRGWVEHAQWNDADVCTCYLKAVMERRAIYGDERLVGDLPL